MEVVELKREYLKRLKEMDDRNIIRILESGALDALLGMSFLFGFEIIKALPNWRRKDEKFRTREEKTISRLEKKLMSKVLAQLSKPKDKSSEDNLNNYSGIISLWRSNSESFREKEAVIMNKKFKLLKDKYLTAFENSSEIWGGLDEAGITRYELNWWIKNIEGFHEERIIIKQRKFLSKIGEGFELKDALKYTGVAEWCYLEWLYENDFRNHMADLYYSSKVKQWRKLRRLLDRESEVWTRIKNFVDSEVADIYADLE
jgi:hypothetical protein